MITFLFGPPGSGKTYEILMRMKQDALLGKPSFLLVPEQETVATERRALLFLPPSAQLSAEVLNFSRLANRVFRVYGGLSYHYIDKGSKTLLMWKTLRELSPILESFDEHSGTDASLSEWLLETIGEMKTSAVTPDMLDHAAKHLAEDSPLRKKLRDVSMITAAYTGLVEASFDDNADDLSKLADLLRHHDFFSGANVYIDSFTSYTAQQLNIIREIAHSADNLTISFAADSPESNALHLSSIVDAARRIAHLVEGLPTETLTLTGNHRTSAPALRALTDSLWNLTLNDSLPLSDEEKSAVTIYTAETVYSEAEFVAHKILSLVRQGYRYRDIAVVARDASKYLGILDFIFQKYDIPCFISEKEDLILLPPVKLLLSALRIVAFHFEGADVLSYLKSGLLPVSQIDADLFEEYVNTWDIAGDAFTNDRPFTMNPDGYTATFTSRGTAILEAANRVKEAIIPPLCTLRDQLQQATTVAEECEALKAFLVTVDLEASLTRLSEERAGNGDLQNADIYARLFDVLISLLDQIARLFSEESDEPLSAEALSSAIRILLGATDIGTIPTAIDEVTVGSAHMLRASNLRAVILVGLAEGEFPATVSESGLFSAAERDDLRSLGVELSYSYRFRSADELLYVTRAIASASEQVILTTHRAGTDGGSCRPSIAFHRAKKLLGIEKGMKDGDLKPQDMILSPRLSLDYYPLLQNTAAGEALRRIYRGDPSLEAVATAAKTPISALTETVSSDCIKTVFGDRMSLSQSRIEAYVKCHFSYYCRYVLSLRETKKAEFGAVDAGTFVHRVLEQFLQNACTEYGRMKSISREEIETSVAHIIEQYSEEILPEEMRLEDRGRLPHLYRKLKEISIMLIENILNELSASEFTPRFFELKLGGSGAPSPLRFILKDGSTLSLPGTVDRVDVWKKDEKLYIRVVDYKTGTKDFSLSDLDVGLNTQMLIYLFTLCHASRFFEGHLKAESGVPTPAGALYLSSAISPVELSTYPDGDTPIDVRSLAEKEFVRSGILTSDRTVLTAMNRDLNPDFLAGVEVQKKSGELSGKALVNPEEFDRIEREAGAIICTVAEAMREGIADADPLLYQGKRPCTYCPMRPICRYERNAVPDEEDPEKESEATPHATQTAVPPTKVKKGNTEILCHVRAMLESGSYDSKTPLPCNTCAMRDTCLPIQPPPKDTPVDNDNSTERRSE